MATLGPDTTVKLENLVANKRLDALVEIKNPLDITPGADDATHVAAVEYLAEDPNIDAVVVGLDPLSPAMRTLAGSEGRNDTIDDDESIALLMPALTARLDKPVVGVIDGGRLYDPLADQLMEKNMAIFRSSDRAVQALAMYIDGRLYAERLRNIHLF
jgi:acyl-CoA synthetase (NDP forming)